MAMMDLAGKAWGVPCWQMLGGKFRDRVRLYADTTERDTPKEQGQLLKERMDKGITFLKQDFGIGLLQDVPGALSMPLGTNIGGGERVMHPFTGIEITDKGIAWLSDWVGQIREVIGMEIPLSTDHYGHISVNSCIKLARAMEKWNLAWMEDMVPWQFGELMKQIRDSTTVPILTGEDIYLKEPFIKLIDMGAVDMIHPDLASSGGLIETKKIGDYAMEHGVAMAMHFAGTPVSFMANVHCAAATENFIALEHHSLDVPWWESLVRTTGGKPLVEKGFAVVPDSPGLGVELNDEVVKQHLRPKSGLLRSDARVGHHPEQRSALELRSRERDKGKGQGLLPCLLFYTLLRFGGHGDLFDRDRVPLHRAGNLDVMTGVGLERRQVLVGDGVDLIPVAHEHVLLAALDTAFNAFPIGHLLRAVLAVLVHGLAHRVADLALVGVRHEPGSRKKSDGRNTRQGLPHTHLH